MSCVLSRVEHAKSPRPSSLLTLFLAVSLLLDIALLRALWLIPVSTAIPAVFTAAFALKAIIAVLEGWSKARPHSPEVTAGLYARAVLAWVTPLPLTGFQKLLRPMAPARKHRLISCCVMTLRWSIIAVVLPRLALLAFAICQPLILNRLLVFLDDTSQSINIGYGIIAAYGLVYSGIALSQALYWHRNARSVTLLRGVLVSAVFSKAIDLSITITDDSAAVTLMSSDVDVIPGITSAMIGHIKSIKCSGLAQNLSDTILNLRADEIKASRPFRILTFQNRTIRENIIGYSHFDLVLYQAVVKACDIEKEFRQLTQGDSTVIGSKGLALSGGQKQRVALARAVYSKPRIALFDDVFSGLDGQTARTMFENLFGERGLLRQLNTTTILATRSVDFLSSADHIICLNKKGKISEQGTFSDLKDTGGYMHSLLRDRVHGFEAPTLATDDIKEQASKLAQATPRQQANEEDTRRQLGDSTVYRYYFSSNGGLFMIVLIVLEIIWAFLESFPTIWLKFWTDDNAKGNDQASYYLGIYTALQVCHCPGSGKVWNNSAQETAIHGSQGTFVSIYHDGPGVNHNTDIGMVDNHLPLGLVVTLASFFGAIAKAGLLASSNPYIAAIFPLLGAVYFYLQRGYLRTSRQLRLIDLEEKAPLYTQFLETLSGLATIRAFGWRDAVMQANHTLVDRSQRPFYLLMIVQRWLVLVLDLTTAALALLLVGLAVRLRGEVDSWTSIETSIGAVARIKQFAEETGEENLPGETRQPPVQWPDKGAIHINDLTASYGDRDGEVIAALDAVSLEIKGGEKVGICGRTGSISIDGISLSSVPRETIRSRLITLTQDQFVLPDTIRHNVDPLDIYSDVKIKEALRLVEFVDRKTEETIKAVIESEFKDHTVVFITHRLDTIVDFDRVIVMDKGCVVELGEPKSLLASGAKFKALWATGHRSGE
ncbi:Multidrug resistance-associated 1 [Fusarium agapanthi]|uniref:Multidrug resistance-associated 1 n=1 Tax=Fusarium agapanthi TaxID=1803897 RepID=A0A9P5EGS0_9HYPO|nr:Multidrug resistance-associated 1 [Fusarium agapanthi]